MVNLLRGLCVVATLVLMSARAEALPVDPAGLNPGDQYHWVFATERTDITAQSTNISDYDAIVQASANAAGLGSVNWKVIGSTAAVAAIDHIDVQGPVYRLDSVRVADNSADLWDAFISAPIDVTENGVSVDDGIVWTGTRAHGSSFTDFELGGASVGRVIFGETDFTSVSWVTAAAAESFHDGRLYGISEPITVAAVPIPAALALFGTALASLGFFGWRKRDAA